MKNDILIPLLNNAVLLLAMATVYDLLTARDLGKKYSISRQIATGIALGFLGIGLILASVQLCPGIVFDTRSVLLSISGLFFGTVPTLVVMVMTAAFRLLQGGAAAWVGTVVILSSGSIGLIWRHLRRGSLEKISAGELYIFGVFNHIVMLAWMFMLPLETAITVLAKISGPVIMIYPLCTVALGLLLAGRLRRRQIAAALIESEKTYRLLFHNKHTVMLLIDPKNGSIVDANPAACTFYGWPHNELCRMQISQINTLPLEQLQKHMGNILSLETHEFLFHHRLADGSLRDVEVLSSPVTFGDRQLLYSIIHDVTARNRTATEKANLLAEASKTRHVLLSVIEDQKLTDTKLQITQFALDHSADAVLWVNEKAEFTYVNLAACQSLGYTKKELLTMSVFDIDPAFPPDYWPLHWQNIQTQGSLEFEAFHRNKDGTTFPVEIHASFICYDTRKYICAFAHNISARKHRETELKRLSTAIEQSPEAVVITDASGIIQYTNPAFETISGYTGREALGKTCSLLKSGQHDAAFYSNLWNTISAGKIWEGRFINKRKNGEIYTEESSVSPVRDSAGTLSGYVAVKRDITEDLAKEEQFRQAQKMDSVGQLAGGIAHDFNNILQAISGFSEILLSRFDAGSVEHRNASEIRKAANRAAELVQQLLAFSRKQPVERKRINLNAEIQDAETLLQLLLGENISHQFELADDLQSIHADHGQITQIIMNLAVNARDAMPNGGRLTIATENVTFEPQAAKGIPEAEPGTFACLSVTDTGCGMSREVLDHLFEPFFTTKEVGHGTGLGLAVVYGIVKQSKGWIHVYSEEGQGSSFKIYLPADKQPTSEQSQPETPDHNGRILLVEDDIDTRNLILRILGTAGYETVAANGARDGLHQFEENAGDFDLLFSDIVLAEESGIDLADALRMKKRTLPVLLCSGYQDQRERWNNLDTKGYRFLKKPFTVTGLLSAVHDTLTEIIQ